VLELVTPFFKRPNDLMDGLVPKKRFVPVIVGELFTGAKFLLMNCSLVNMYSYIGDQPVTGSHKTEFIRVDYAFAWLDDWAVNADAKTFSGGKFDYGPVLAWMNLCRYHCTSRAEFQSTVVWNASETKDIKLCNGLCLSFTPEEGSLPLLGHETSYALSQRVGVEFAYERCRSWKEVVSDADWFRKFIELGKGLPVGIARAEYRYSKSVREDAKCVSAAERTPVNHCGEVLLGDFRAANEDERDMPDLYLFDLEDAIDSRAVENWFKEREVLQPIVELYSLMYSDRVIPSAALFLNLTQALEAFHSRMVCSDIKSYKVRVKVLVTSDKSATRGLNEFLCDAGQSKASHVYLKSRLSDLLYADGAWPIQIRKMSNANFVHGVIDTRNYLTHYDPKKELLSFTNDELKTVNMELLTLLEFHLMKAVGFDSTFAKEHVQRRLEFLLG
jgi:hypothetical protein